MARLRYIDTELAWLRGWDAGIIGTLGNPYRRPEQARAFDRGRKAALDSKPAYVNRMKQIVAERIARGLPIR